MTVFMIGVFHLQLVVLRGDEVSAVAVVVGIIAKRAMHKGDRG
jgi:hypothetical protein